MALTYPALVSQIQNYIEDDGVEFQAAIPIFIDNAETQLARDLDLSELNAIVTVTVNPGTSCYLLDKPANLVIANVISFTSTGKRKQLRLKTLPWLQDYWPERTSVGSPLYYAPFGSTKWIIAPAVSVTTEFEIQFPRKPDALTSTSTTNVLTSIASDALLYYSLAEANRFIKNFNAASQWEQKYSATLTNILNQGRRQRRDDMDQPDAGVAENNTV